MRSPREAAARPGGGGGGASPFGSAAGGGAAAAGASDRAQPSWQAAGVSPLWAVFTQLLAQAAGQRPLVVLATAHVPTQALPAELVAFFQQGAPARPGVGGQGVAASGGVVELQRAPAGAIDSALAAAAREAAASLRGMVADGLQRVAGGGEAAAAAAAAQPAVAPAAAGGATRGSAAEPVQPAEDEWQLGRLGVRLSPAQMQEGRRLLHQVRGQAGCTAAAQLLQGCTAAVRLPCPTRMHDACS
jgi:flagellar hook-length control protein FliK